jgi:hypothetical protein
MADINAPLAGFGTTPLEKVQAKAGERPLPPSKYKDFMTAIHEVLFSDKNIDEQTELDWTNIEGEVMAEVLVKDMVSGTMFVPVRNRMFQFKSPESQIDKLFIGKFVEVMNKHPELVPAITTGKRKINELMVSYLRHGRMELVEMVKAFQVQMQETQRDESKLLRR